ncbi:hypothetical protein RIF29_17143 [Crotalaria pallida]|uniref:Uncharacterized protein n=1 Tax=Crotalaria pallida TaxID=3830 RepID=A0AAN9FNK6_CROPI
MGMYIGGASYYWWRAYRYFRTQEWVGWLDCGCACDTAKADALAVVIVEEEEALLCLILRTSNWCDVDDYGESNKASSSLHFLLHAFLSPIFYLLSHSLPSHLLRRPTLGFTNSPNFRVRGR